MKKNTCTVLILHAMIMLLSGVLLAQNSHAAILHPQSEPNATVDLATEDGVKLVHGAWRYSDTKIIEADFLAPGSDGQPSNKQVRTYDFTPHAGGTDFDDSSWPVITPNSLSERRGNGRLSFNWYRITITVPDMVGTFDTTGSDIVFNTSIDDYAEVWVNGELTRYAGQVGGSVIGGWNSGNWLKVGHNVKPGQKITLAVFGMNGPISNPPTNYIWMRFAKLLFFRQGPGETTPWAIPPSEVNVLVERDDPAIDALVPLNAKLFKLAEGFQFTEGPVWSPEGKYLLFSDPNANTIYKYVGLFPAPVDTFRKQSGYNGGDIAEYSQPGSNGLTRDPQGRLTINQHGNRRVIRIENDGTETIMADAFEGKRLNSPNDLVYRSDGALFFTDPPFGLPKFHQDKRKELPFEGVFSVLNGKISLVSKDMTGPNGIAFSPDEKYLYVSNWDEKKKVIYRYEVTSDAQLKNGFIFFDMTGAPGEDALDGMKVDVRGNLYVSGPGGLWVISPKGKRLGLIITPMHVHNLAWGDDDHKTLYLCARTGLYRMRVNVAGAGIPNP